MPMQSFDAQIFSYGFNIYVVLSSREGVENSVQSVFCSVIIHLKYLKSITKIMSSEYEIITLTLPIRSTF